MGGSARATKMAPYFQVAKSEGEDQLSKTPVVLVPDVDHSDMCEGFPVPGDLPSALKDPKAAIQSLAEPTAAFMKQQILNDKSAAASIKEHLKFTEGVMDPINTALTMERQWCHDLQKSVAGPLASKIKSM